MDDVFGQAQYQVRFDWGIQGAEAVAVDADVIVVVDVLSFSTTVDLATTRGVEVGLSPSTITAESSAALTRVAVPSPNGSRISAALNSHPALVVAGSLRNAAAIAEWTLAQQDDKGGRFTVAVIAAGETREDGTLRFALEDLLGAGAIIDALAEVGIDYCSPEAAATAASFTGLRNATGHLIGASSSGRELAAQGFRADVDLAIELNASTTVPVLREFVFKAER